jgi:hypothetical protein
MDYDFFQSLTAEGARAYLNRFLEVERQALEDMKPAAAREGVSLDYSMSTLADALKWMAKRVRIERLPVPAGEPWWIRQAHRDGVAEFDDDSKSIVLRAAYYLGECFARRPGLRWTTGNSEYMEKNMPVVAGFRLDQELPPIVVIDNMFARIAGDGGPLTRIDSTIEVWSRDCPSAGTATNQ